MTIRSFVYDLVTHDPELIAIGLNDSTWYSRGLNTPDTIQERPYAVLAWGNTIPGLDVVNRRYLQVWVYDEPDDYERIDRALQRVRNVLTSVAGARTGANDLWISQIIWEGISDDLTDDSIGAIMRNGQFSIVGSAA